MLNDNCQLLRPEDRREYRSWFNSWKSVKEAAINYNQAIFKSLRQRQAAEISEARWTATVKQTPSKMNSQ